MKVKTPHREVVLNSVDYMSRLVTRNAVCGSNVVPFCLNDCIGLKSTADSKKLSVQGQGAISKKTCFAVKVSELSALLPRITW